MKSMLNKALCLTLLLSTMPVAFATGSISTQSVEKSVADVVALQEGSKVEQTPTTEVQPTPEATTKVAEEVKVAAEATQTVAPAAPATPVVETAKPAEPVKTEVVAPATTAPVAPAKQPEVKPEAAVKQEVAKTEATAKAVDATAKPATETAKLEQAGRLAAAGTAVVNFGNTLWGYAKSAGNYVADSRVGGYVKDAGNYVASSRAADAYRTVSFMKKDDSKYVTFAKSLIVPTALGLASLAAYKGYRWYHADFYAEQAKKAAALKNKQDELHAKGVKAIADKPNATPAEKAAIAHKVMVHNANANDRKPAPVVAKPTPVEVRHVAPVVVKSAPVVADKATLAATKTALLNAKYATDSKARQTAAEQFLAAYGFGVLENKSELMSYVAALQQGKDAQALHNKTVIGQANAAFAAAAA